MCWLTITEYLCYKWPGICYVCSYHNPDMYLFIILLFVVIVTRPVAHMELKLLTFAEHQSSTLMSWCSLFWFMCNVIVCSFSFGHCIVLHFSSYCLWIPICYLQSCPTFILLLVVDVKQFLVYPPFLIHFSDLILLFGQLIMLLFLCTCFKYCWTYANRTHAVLFENFCRTAWLRWLYY